MPFRRFLVLAAALAAACAPVPGPAPAPGTGAAGEALVSSLSVQPAGDTVLLTLQVTNATTAPLDVVFPSGQTYDFAVRGPGGDLWRWSADRSFIQAVRTLTLAPGATWTYDEAWTPPAGVRGELTAQAWLVSSSHPVERTAAFRLP